MTHLLRSSCLLALFTLLPNVGQAEILGLIAGREAKPAITNELSVELGIVNGELDDADYQNIAARVNYKLSPELVVSATLGTGEFGLSDGTPFGASVLYFLANQRISENLNIAGKASYHGGEYSFRELDGDLTALALEVLVSGAQPLMDNGLAWYSNAGYHRITVDFSGSDTSHELGLGAGLVLPNALGEGYLGLEFIDGLSFGLGIRYFVQ